MTFDDVLASVEQPLEKFARECSRGELSESMAAYRVEDLMRVAYAAGAAHGAESAIITERQRCWKIADTEAIEADEISNLHGHEMAAAIADAIAKETAP